MAYNSTIDKATDDILIYGNTAKDGSGTSYVPLLDTDGHLQLDVLSSALPSGASTAANQTTIIGHVDGIEGLLTTIDADTSTLAGAVSGTEMQVDVITMPSVAVTNAGTFVVQENGAALTALQLIDDSVLVFGTATYTEAVTKGIAIGGIRRDADTTLVDTTNEFSPFQLDANGRLKVEAFSGETLPVSLASVPSHAVTNAGTFVVQENGAALTSLQLIDDAIVADDAVFTPATTKVMMAGFEFDDTTPDSVNEGDGGAARMSANRNIYVNIRDNAGNERGLNIDANGELGISAIRSALPSGTNAIGKLAANSGVDIGDVDVTSIIPGTGATNLGKARDSAIGATDTGVAMLGVRRDTPTAETPAAGDYVVPQYSANGEAWVRMAGELADDAAFTVATTRVLPVGLLADETATDSVDEGDIGASRMTLDRKAIVTPLPHSANGLTIHKTDALVATAVAVKASAGNLYGYHIYNPNTSDIYVQFYNIAQGSTTVGTSSRSISLVVPALGVLDGVFPMPVSFTTAITIAATTTLTGSSAPSTGLVTNIFYF